MDFLKAEQLSTSKWRVLAIPFGGHLGGKDSDGEFFSKNTNIYPDWFDRRPLVWHHNLDRTMRDKANPREDADPVIGTTDDLEEQADGWWVTAWLKRQHQYFSEIDSLLRRGKMFGSSGTLPNFVRIDHKSGEIKSWPYVEQTFSLIPANLLARTVPAKTIDHFDAADITLDPALRGILLDLEAEPADLRPDLPSGGDDAAIQRLPSDPRIEAAKRHLAALAPKVGRLTTR